MRKTKPIIIMPLPIMPFSDGGDLEGSTPVDNGG